jgi:hypothetical protein
MPPKSANISKFKKSLKNPVLADPEATFNKNLIKTSPVASPQRMSSPKSPRSPKVMSPQRTSSPKSPRSPKASPQRSSSPKRSTSPVTSPVRLPVYVPGVITEETIESRFIVERPSAERYANRDIIRENPKVTMEELSIILGVTKVSLPKIDTSINTLPLPKVKASSPKSTSPRRSASPRSKSPTKKVCNVMLGDKPIDKSMITVGKKSSGKPVYSMAELKQIATQLGISSTGVKDTVVANILKELEKRGC